MTEIMNAKVVSWWKIWDFPVGMHDIRYLRSRESWFGVKGLRKMTLAELVSWHNKIPVLSINSNCSFSVSKICFSLGIFGKYGKVAADFSFLI